MWYSILWKISRSLTLADVDVNATLFNIVTAFAAFVGGAAALALLYAGYLWIFAGDNHQQEAQARKAIGYAILGAVVALSAVTLSKLITGSVVPTK